LTQLRQLAVQRGRGLGCGLGFDWRSPESLDFFHTYGLKKFKNESRLEHTQSWRATH
jgi:hypothetical protein